MSLFPEFSAEPSGRAVLLSIKPRYADLILAGTKQVELRRSWPSNDIGVMVLYSSAPIQKLVGVAYVDRVEEADIPALWALAKKHGGGVSKAELVEYFAGKQFAYGVMIRSVRAASRSVDPKDLFPNFVPPQSFQYLAPEEFRRVSDAIFLEG
jgi:predicted transcriptional regulator